MAGMVETYGSSAPSSAVATPSTRPRFG